MFKHGNTARNTIPATSNREATPLPHERKSATYLAAEDLDSILPCHDDDKAGRHEHKPARRRDAVPRDVDEHECERGRRRR